MTDSATPDASAVDSAGALPPDWSGHWPDRYRDESRVPVASRSWFEAVYPKNARMSGPVGWRFTCPFCGEKYEHEHHSETYVLAYRHLAVCDWVIDPLWTGVVE